MAFSSPFSRAFSPTFDRRNAGGYKIWYTLDGAITCLAAYQPKGAASYAASKVNLANSGTYDLQDKAAYPAWDTLIGWTFTAASSQGLDIGFGTGPTLKPCSLIARIDHNNAAAYRSIIAGTATNALQWRLDTDHKQTVNKENAANIGTSTSAVPDGNVVIAFTYSNVGAFVFYLNGATDGSGTNNQTIAADTDLVGYKFIGGAEMFGGVIVALALYASVLDGATIATLTTAMNAL